MRPRHVSPRAEKEYSCREVKDALVAKVARESESEVAACTVSRYYDAGRWDLAGVHQVGVPGEGVNDCSAKKDACQSLNATWGPSNPCRSTLTSCRKRCDVGEAIVYRQDPSDRRPVEQRSCYH